MQRVLTVSLNRNAYQIEEDAHARLAEYLADAGKRLAGNPDRTEILFDLEQAIADQCKKRMQQGYDVITLTELGPSLEEIGAVEVPDVSGTPSSPSQESPPALQQVSEGAVLSGICKGLARAAKIDVTLVRVIALVLLFVSGGAMLLLYVIMMLIVPFAPLEPNGQPLRKIPAKCRDLVTLVRTKLGMLVS